MNLKNLTPSYTRNSYIVGVQIYKKKEIGRMILSEEITEDSAMYSLHFVKRGTGPLEGFPVAGGHLSLSGHSQHKKRYTKNQVKKLINRGIKTLSYQTGWELVQNLEVNQ